MANDVIQVVTQNSLQISDWVLIGTALFLGIIALIVPWLSELIKRHLFAPSLEIDFEQKPPDCHITRNKAITSDGEILRDEPVFYFRFRVSNTGKTQAKKCEVVLEQLYQSDVAGNFKAFERYSPINIIWGSFQGEHVDINPKRRYFCDLFHIPSKDDQKIWLLAVLSG